MNPLHDVTPLWHSTCGDSADRRILYKMDALQPAGSFKIRGIGRLCVDAVQHGARAIVASSGGNAGMAAAWAGKKLGVPVTVFVPKTTGEVMRARLRQIGATVHEFGAAWDETHHHAVAFAAQENAAYAHPFDHPLIWDGHASIIHELATQTTKPKSIIVSVGGGGLLLGILTGLRQIGWDDVRVLAIETKGTASLAASITAGQLVTLSAITGIATSLGARAVATEALNQSLAFGVESVQVSDHQAINAVKNFANEKRILVEPACGAALAIGYERADLLGPGDHIVIVCGGNGVSLEQISAW